MYIKKTVYFILIANLNIWAYGFVELFLIFQNFIDLSNEKQRNIGIVAVDVLSISLASPVVTRISPITYAAYNVESNGCYCP